MPDRTILLKQAEDVHCIATVNEFCSHESADLEEIAVEVSSESEEHVDKVEKRCKYDPLQNFAIHLHQMEYSHIVLKICPRPNCRVK